MGNPRPVQSSTFKEMRSARLQGKTRGKALARKPTPVRLWAEDLAYLEARGVAISGFVRDVVAGAVAEMIAEERQALEGTSKE